MTDIARMLLAAGTAFSVSLVLSECLRRLLTRWVVLDRPNGERWHRTPRPRLGGVAIFAAFLIAGSLFGEHPLPRAMYGLLAGAAFVFVWSLIDDLWRLPNGAKLPLLVLTGIIPPAFGFSFPTPWPLWGAVITALWVTGVTNAVNWLDNMDGVAAGVVAIAATTFLALSVISGNGLAAIMALALGGAVLGFLARNFPPAKIFMGDCGSGVLGYLLAVTGVLIASGMASPFPRPIFAAVFALGVPLLDTALVAIQRVMHGRSILVGGKDHLAHRLVTLGFSEREVVAVLYALAVATGSVAMLTVLGPGAVRAPAIAAGIALAASIGIAGSLVNVYQRPSILRSYVRGLTIKNPAVIWQAVVVIGALGLLYYPMLRDLLYQWWTDPEDSHGLLVPFVVAYLIWRQREPLRRCPAAPSAFGYLVILLGLVLLVVGQAALFGYLMRVSLLVVLVGLLLFLSGPPMVKILAFPLAFSLFMIPLPYIVYDRITLPLQFVASQLATTLLDAVGIPVLRQGNIITLPTTQLGVTEACSGIRSLMALGALSTIYVYLVFPNWWRRLAIVASTVPIAIGANAARVAITGILADRVGHQAAMGFYHTFSGLLVFALAAILMLLLGSALSAIARPVLVGETHATSL